MPREAVLKSSLSVYDQEFANLIQSKAKQDNISIPLLAKRALANYLGVSIPVNDDQVYRPAVGKYAHIIGKNKVREQNLKNLTQYILDNWQTMPDDIKAQVIANQESNNA